MSKLDVTQHNTPNETIGIVFLHHDTNPVSANNLKSFRDWNPNTLIVTIGVDEKFESGYSIHDFPDYEARWNRHLCTHRDALFESVDLLLYAWYSRRRETCDRWLIVGSESFCVSSVEEFCAAVWNFDVSGPSVRWPNREPEWRWFSAARSLPIEVRPCAVGIVPFSFILIRDSVLDAICRAVPCDNLGTANSELRFATLAHACGPTPVAHPLAGWNISWQALPETTALSNGMWYPVKWLAQGAPVGQRVSAESNLSFTMQPKICGWPPPVFQRPRCRNLIYTIAFDQPEELFHQLMAKLLVSSIFRTGFEGDVLILTNSQYRVFERGRDRLEEINLDSSRIQGDIGFQAQRFKAVARQFIDASAYDKIMFVDCDCLFMDSPDRLFEGDADIGFAVEPLKITAAAFNGYLTDYEMLTLNRPGINSGTQWVRGSVFNELMTKWEYVIDSPPPRHDGWRDQTAWVRVLLNTDLRALALPRPGGVYYPLLEKVESAEMFAGTLWHFLSLRTSAPKIPHMFGHYMRRFHSEVAFSLMSLLEV